MRYSLASRSPPARLPALPAAQAAVQITIDKSAQLMTVETRRTRPLSVAGVHGKSRIRYAERQVQGLPHGARPLLREWDDAPMPFSIFFTQKGHAIHGSLDTKNIGRPASHGCVRLTPANAEKLFALVQEDGVLNTTVILTGIAPSRAPAVAKLRAPDELERIMCNRNSPHTARATARTSRPMATAIRAAALLRTAAICPAAICSAHYARPQYGQPTYAQPQYVQPPRPVYFDPSADVPAPGHVVSLLAPAAENLWTRRLR